MGPQHVRGGKRNRVDRSRAHGVFHRPLLQAIYSHPLEFLVGNVPVVALGPLLLGSHLSIFYLWAFAAVFQTCINHCGWQLPLLTSGNQTHDYHHSTYVTYGLLLVIALQDSFRPGFYMWLTVCCWVLRCEVASRLGFTGGSRSVAGV